MAKEAAPPEPVEDIPAWFMTYSDVITLLMTFFILLLTFSSTEPEKFEQVSAKFLGDAGATGVVGYEHDKMEKTSYTERMRPRAARMAMNGSEMPPAKKEPSTQARGKGLVAPNEEEAARDVMTPYSLTLDIDKLVNEQLKLTRKGFVLAAKLAPQLQSLPVHLAIEVQPDASERATAFADHLFHVEMARPGQVSVGIEPGLESGKVRFIIERYED